MRLALAPTPGACLDLLGSIDATRAPLHPLLLWGWVRIFGPSEFAARSLSAACGVLTVTVSFALGKRLGTGAGLGAAFLTAYCPLFIDYSREARMYSLLVLLTASVWWALLRLHDRVSTARLALLAVLVAAMILCHPLGLLMLPALGLAAVIERRSLAISPLRWALTIAATGLMLAPWIWRYFDHDPESTSGRLPLRFLLGLPIGFTGGDSRILAALAVAIAIGLWPRSAFGITKPRTQGTPWPFVSWLVVPPTLLYTYSWLSWPIFGPSRYNLFVAPAYFVLVATALARLRWIAAIPAWIALGALVLLHANEARLAGFRPKADWRGAAEWLDRERPGVPVVVIPPTSGRNFEADVARFYLGDRRAVLAMPDPQAEPGIVERPGRRIFAASLRLDPGSHALNPVGSVPDALLPPNDRVAIHDEDGLRLYERRP